MAQAGYTPISLYYSTTPSAVPVNTNLVNGELAINITDGKLYYKDNGGVVRLLASNATSTPVTSIAFGTTGLTPSAATSGAISVAGTLVAANGGTGQSSYTIGDLLFASSSTALSKLADVATGNALISGGVGVAPSYGKIGLTTHISGTLAIGNGGTGQTTAGAAFNALSPITTTGDLIIGNGANSATRLAIGANGTVLTSNGTTATWAVASGGAGAPIGAFQWFGGTTTTTYPGSDWLKCDGSIVSQTTYSTLYARIGLTPDALSSSVFYTTPGTSLSSNTNMQFLNNQFVCKNANPGLFITSTDAVTWTAVSTSSLTMMDGLAYGNSTYVGVRQYPVGKSVAYEVATSTDLITWVARSAGFNVKTRPVRFVNGNFVVLSGGSGSNLNIATSTNGISWTIRTVSGIGSAFATLGDIGFVSGRYVLSTIGSSGKTFTSTDLVTWQTISVLPAGYNGPISQLSTANNVMFAGGLNAPGFLLASTDGITFTSRSVFNSITPIAVQYVGNSYLAFQGGTGVAISPDSVSWYNINTPPNPFGDGIVAFGANKLASVGGSGPSAVTMTPFSYNISTNFALPRTLGLNNYVTSNADNLINTTQQIGTTQTLYVKGL